VAKKSKLRTLTIKARPVHKGKVITLWIASFIALGCIAIGLSYAATPPTAASRGGSNYDFYNLAACNRDPYGTIKSFNKDPAAIKTQLATMIKNGQSRLRIGIFHLNASDGLSGTLMNSTGGNLSQQNRQNLTNLLAAVKQAGFSEIEIAYHPQGGNNPATWSSWNESVYQENWNLIYNLRPLLIASGIQYRVDLMNEATPAVNQPVLAQYAKRLWSDYTYTFGRNDTFGFSIGIAAAADINRIDQMKAIYGTTPPYVFDLHFYGSPQYTENQEFVAADTKMKKLGYTQGWVIGEGYYNDATAAAGFKAAITSTKRTVYYLLQWPLTRQRTCADVDVASPTSFSAYINQGF